MQDKNFSIVKMILTCCLHAIIKWNDPNDQRNYLSVS